MLLPIGARAIQVFLAQAAALDQPVAQFTGLPLQLGADPGQQRRVVKSSSYSHGIHQGNAPASLSSSQTMVMARQFKAAVAARYFR